MNPLKGKALSFKDRMALLDKALSRETPESLAAKLHAYGDYTEYNEEGNCEMNPFITRLEMLPAPESRETPKSLAEKFKAHGYTCDEKDILEEVPEICWQIAHWNNNEKYQRRIVCAANRFKLKDGGTLVIPGARHYSKDMAEVLDQVSDKLVSDHVCGVNQGFIDQYSNYWTREEAMIIATYANQVRIERGGSEKELYSEDLY